MLQVVRTLSRGGSAVGTMRVTISTCIGTQRGKKPLEIGGRVTAPTGHVRSALQTTVWGRTVKQGRVASGGRLKSQIQASFMR